MLRRLLRHRNAWLVAVGFALCACTSPPESSVTASVSPTVATPPAAPPAASPLATAASADAVASTAAIPTSELPRVAFVRRDGSRVTLPVEVPPRSEYSVGLSGRGVISGRGMLFYFAPDETNPGFWMKDTHIDLSIAFVSNDGVLLMVSEMQAESLEIVMPDAHYQYAVEAPAGWYSAEGVGVGDVMQLEFDLPPNILEE